MAPILTLYDVLKVSRDAPPEVIRASYKVLSQKHHPDRNPTDEHAAAMMQRINSAYAILSVPEKRQKHDRWVAQREREASKPANKQHSHSRERSTSDEPHRGNDRAPSKKREAQTSATKGFLKALKPIVALGALLGILWLLNLGDKSRPIDSSPARPVPSTKSVHCRPVTLSESSRWANYPAGGLYNCQDSQGHTTYPATPPLGAVVEPQTSDSAVLARRTDPVSSVEHRPLAIGECRRLFGWTSSKLKRATGKPVEGALYECRTAAGNTTYISEAELNRMRDHSAANAPPANRGEKYQRPVAAPNGAPWPKSAAYLSGYDKLNVKGYSKVTVDNADNDSDVFVKLYSLRPGSTRPVRHIFVPAHKRFTMNKIDAGPYDVRYKDLDSGAIQRSERFELQQTTVDEGIQYSDMSLTLYKVSNGNMETFVIDEQDF